MKYNVIDNNGNDRGILDGNDTIELTMNVRNRAVVKTIVVKDIESHGGVLASMKVTTPTVPEDDETTITSTVTDEDDETTSTVTDEDEDDDDHNKATNNDNALELI